MRIDIVIPTNNPENLERCLKSIRNQNKAIVGDIIIVCYAVTSTKVKSIACKYDVADIIGRRILKYST